MEIQMEVAHSVVLYGCRNVRHLQVGGGRLTGWFTTRLRRLDLDRLIREAGFSCFGSHIHRFSALADDGYTYVMIIGQSAINIHTYPQQRTVSVWLITCPGEDDNGFATKKLKNVLSRHFGSISSKSGSLGNIPLQCAV